MERMIKALPLPILLMGVSALAMYVPAIHALLTHHHHTARAFFYSATLFLFATALIGLANGSNPRPARAGRASLLIMLAAFTVLPLMLAVPFYVAVRDTSFFNSWWEMVSAFTTTGGTLYEPTRLVGSVHLWRGLVAWMGGFFILVMAIAVLAPMRLGGFEVFFSGGPSGAPAAAAPAADGGAEMSERIAHYAFKLARERRKKVTNITKSNAMLHSLVYWDKVIEEVSQQYPDVDYGIMLVDAATMKFVQNPAFFDVIVTTNQFGDILSDLGGAM
uniref:isocitrate/isopropylmalate family dehydrogenase n=1 Tax=Thioclava electrotropha TaxID=1549850 RepID=UPI0023A8649C